MLVDGLPFDHYHTPMIDKQKTNTHYPDPRAICAHALQGVYERRIGLDTALHAQEGYHQLESRDRAFARLLCATTLRRTGQIDLVLTKFLEKPPHGFAHAVLRSGVAQILFLGTPPHAAVNSSVNLLKTRKKTKGYSGLINAVLRRVIEKGPAILATTRPLDNIPGWLRESWFRTYGRPAVRRFAQILTQDPPLDLQLKDQSTQNVKHWAEILGAEILPDQTLRLAKTAQIENLKGFGDGEWWVQDTAASLPVKLLGDIKGKTVLDMCAAPGGKTMQLSAGGALVTALDKSGSRLGLIEQNLKRTKLHAELIAADATEWSSGREFDIVLLDAPCSATGTFRRHPDVIHNKTQRDVKSLVALQKRLLSAATHQVKPGGTLGFCTCSLEAREGEEQIAKFMKNRPEFRLNSELSISVIGANGALTREGFVRMCPDMLFDKGGMDGFFIAMFTRC